MSAQDQKPIAYTRTRWIAVFAAFSLGILAVTFAYLAWYAHNEVPNLHCGPGLCGAAGLIYPLIGGLLAFATTGSIAALGALIQAATKRDLLSTLSLAVALIIGTVAALSLGGPGQPGIAAAFGFPLANSDVHPFAYGASSALVLAIPALALARALTRGRIPQLIALAGAVFSVALLLAIRLFG